MKYKIEWLGLIKIFLNEKKDCLDFSSQKIEIEWGFAENALKDFADDKDSEFAKRFPRSAEFFKLLKSRNFFKRKNKEILDYFFKSKEKEFILNVIFECIKSIIERYGAFPSITEKTTLIKLHILDSYTGSVFSIDNSYYATKIHYPIYLLKTSKEHNIYFFTHELYHIICIFHYGQKKQTGSLKQLETQFSDKIKKDRKKIIGLFNDQDSIFHVNLFYNNLKKTSRTLYTDVIADVALNFVALKLGDNFFLHGAIITDEENVKLLKIDFSKINNYSEESKEHAILSVLAAFNRMPFNALAHVIASKNLPAGITNRARECEIIIKDYEEMLKKNMNKNTLTLYNRFWKQFKDIVSKMDICAKPSRNITREIHNLKSINRAKRGYIILHEIIDEIIS